MKTKNKMENRPAQRDSGNSNLGVLGILGRKTRNENRPAQRDSGNSNLKTSLYRPYRPYRPLDFKTSPAQRDSGNSNLRMGEHCHTEGTEHTEK